MSSLYLIQRPFDWDGGNSFVWLGRCREWGAIAPRIDVSKKTDFKTIIGGTLAHWIRPRFLSKHFINLLTSQPDVFF